MRPHYITESTDPRRKPSYRYGPITVSAVFSIFNIMLPLPRVQIMDHETARHRFSFLAYSLSKTGYGRSLAPNKGFYLLVDPSLSYECAYKYWYRHSVYIPFESTCYIIQGKIKTRTSRAYSQTVEICDSMTRTC